MKTIYSLRTDPGLAQIQAASLGTETICLKPTHGLVGTPEWWSQIDKGLLPIETTTGTVIHLWLGHHGDWPEIEVREPDGSSSNWGCHVPASEAVKYFTLGSKVQIDHVAQELKVEFYRPTAMRLNTAIRVETNQIER